MATRHAIYKNYVNNDFFDEFFPSAIHHPAVSFAKLGILSSNNAFRDNLNLRNRLKWALLAAITT
jgi:hypothetical protein